MRSDVLINNALARCEALKRSGLWPPEPRIRPRAWLNNFLEEDQALAATLLERFNFYNEPFTDRLLLTSYHSLADGLPKGPNAPDRASILHALSTAVFTPVEGERPNITDSGNLLCRKARQLLKIPADRIVDPNTALACAIRGEGVVFLDDFIGSGDQFLTTWTKDRLFDKPRSFAEAHAIRPFSAIYVTLVCTDFGLGNIAALAPMVAVSAAHTFDESATYRELKSDPSNPDPGLPIKVRDLLEKYSSRLTPQESYIASNPAYKAFGYKCRGLLLAFYHSVPDATLPIFWSPGTNNWTPLVART